MFGKRADGQRITAISNTRRFMPLISPRRNASLVYYTTEIEVGPALAFLEEQNRNRPQQHRITLFHLYLRSLSISLHDRSGVNRFVAGGRLWQRDGVFITYSAKQEILDGSPVLTIKRKFERDEGLVQMVDSLRDELLARRRGKQSTSDKEVNVFVRLPPFLVRAGIGALRLADYLGLLPAAMIESDPMFSSIFVANLGSVGLDAGYHHLWEYGTCSNFAVVGRVHDRHDGVAVMEVKYSYDERIEDGLYAAITMTGIKDRLEDPKQLL
ncbi:MAG: hypothetical protein JRH17_14655 [Deltaproteobacteria bacterium]|nr:hypothetical protein [Deltaproteobacteria bacterium]MBW2698459.1 hypothetical protein [Deltaproteobacteria bacterium]